MARKTDARQATIKPGDFIRAQGIACSGYVVRVGSVRYGRGHIDGYVIDKGGGREDFIDARSAVLLWTAEEMEQV